LERLIYSLGDPVYGLIVGYMDTMPHMDDEVVRSQAGSPSEVGFKGIEGFAIEIPILGGQVGKVGQVNKEGKDG
jgi:hypothetical protein